MMDERNQLIEELRATVQSLTDTNAALTATIAELQETIVNFLKSPDMCLPMTIRRFNLVIAGYLIGDF